MRHRESLPITTAEVVADLASLLAEGYLRHRREMLSQAIEIKGDNSESGLDSSSKQSVHACDGEPAGARGAPLTAGEWENGGRA